MKFLPLIHLSIKHSYYTNGRCSDFHMKPAAETEKWLKNHRAILKPFADGIQLCMAVRADDTPFIPMPDTSLFHFYLYLNNPDFHLFTDLSQIATISDPLYTNHNLDSGNREQLTLISRQTQTLPPPPKGCFAEVTIAHTPAQATSIPSFQINFTAKQTRWRYYVIADRSDAQFHIQDNASTPLTFGEANQTHLNQQPDNTDEIGQALVAQFPNKQYYRFLSDNLIACQQRARKSLQLHLNGNQIVTTLPNPSLHSYTVAPVTQNDTAQKEATMFEVVKYFMHE